MKISVIILTYKRPELLLRCLDSIKKSTRPEDFEVIIGYNNDEDNFNKDSGKKYVDFFEIKTYLLKKSPNGNARNQIIKKASGDWICFLDNDVTIPTNYFIHAKETITKYNDISLLGGPDLTNKSPTLKQKIIGSLQENPLITGPTYYRHKMVGDGPKYVSEENLILCNLWIKADIFIKENIYFNDHISRNEENLLMDQLKSNGHKMLYVPDLYVWHFRKDNFKKLAVATYSSGQNRIKTFFLYPKSFKWIYLVPLICLLYMCTIFIFGPTIFNIIPLIIYQICILHLAFKNLFRFKNFHAFAYSYSASVLIHISYATGMLFSIINELTYYLKPQKGII